MKAKANKQKGQTLKEFNAGENVQQLQKHIQLLEQFGLEPRDTSGEHRPLHDLECWRTGTPIECKTENREPINFAIELASNLTELPPLQDDDLRIYPWHDDYKTIAAWLIKLYQGQSNKLGYGLSRQIQPNHLLSHLFIPSDTYNLFNLSELQSFTKRALIHCKYELVIIQSYYQGRSWYSINMIVKYSDLTAISCATATATARIS